MRGLPEGLRLRLAEAADTETMAGLILARLTQEGLPTPTTQKVLAGRLAKAMQGERPLVEGVLAETKIQGSEHSDAEGLLMFHELFSASACTPGLWVADLCLKERSRGQGVGWALMARLARVALERDFPLLQFTIRTGNQFGLEMYQRMGAKVIADRTVMYLQGKALERLARDSAGL